MKRYIRTFTIAVRVTESERNLIQRAADIDHDTAAAWLRKNGLVAAELQLGIRKPPEPPAPPEPPSITINFPNAGAVGPAIPVPEPDPESITVPDPWSVAATEKLAIAPYPVPSTPPPISEEDAAETERRKAAMRQLAADPEEMARREREYRELLSREAGAHNPAPDLENA